MADIAVVFHWPPSVMAAMSIEELTMWLQKARRRHDGSAESDA